MLEKLRNIKANRKGFTLIEVLLVVAIIAILAGIVILAVNPAKQLADTRNAQRRSDVNTIMNALYQYSIDNNGNLPTTVTALNVDTPTDICTTGTVGAACALVPGVDLAVLTANGKYLVSIPKDPSYGTATNTFYKVSRDQNGRLKVQATGEQGATIEVTR